jgi:hypothetical protein
LLGREVGGWLRSTGQGRKGGRTGAGRLTRGQLGGSRRDMGTYIANMGTYIALLHFGGSTGIAWPFPAWHDLKGAGWLRGWSADSLASWPHLRPTILPMEARLQPARSRRPPAQSPPSSTNAHPVHVPLDMPAPPAQGPQAIGGARVVRQGPAPTALDHPPSECPARLGTLCPPFHRDRDACLI